MFNILTASLAKNLYKLLEKGEPQLLLTRYYLNITHVRQSMKICYVQLLHSRVGLTWEIKAELVTLFYTITYLVFTPFCFVFQIKCQVHIALIRMNGPVY